MVVNEVARVYAGALLEIGKEQNILDQVAEELKFIIDLLKEDADFLHYMKAPGFTKESKKSLIDKVFKNQLSDIIINFFSVLIDNDRHSIIEEVYESLSQLLDVEKNRLRVKVISSTKLEESVLSKVQSALQDKFKKQIILEEKVDQSIIGGIIIRIGDLIIDGSISKDLKNIREKLLLSKVRSEVAYED